MGGVSPAVHADKVRCRRCSKFHSPHYFVINHVVGFCLDCLLWHRHALDVFCGATPKGCQECGVTFAALSNEFPDGQQRMYLHPRDGIYQVLCPPCSDAYERKRLDLYGSTPMGWAKKLKGAH